MQKHINVLSILVILAAATPVQAQTPKSMSPWYGELAYAPVKAKSEGAGYSASKNLRGIIGYELHPNVAVEGLLSLGVGDGSSTDPSFQEDFRVDRAVGLYVRPKFAVSEDIELYARLGYARTKVTYSWTGGSESNSESDVSYGLGAAYRINDRWSAVADFMRYSDKDGVRMQGFSAGLRLRF